MSSKQSKDELFVYHDSKNGNDIEKKIIVDKENIPYAKLIMVLGILSIIVNLILVGIFGILIGLIAISLANRARIVYSDDPPLYSFSSYRNMVTGNICGIIGIIIGTGQIIARIIINEGIIWNMFIL